MFFDGENGSDGYNKEKSRYSGNVDKWVAIRYNKRTWILLPITFINSELMD